MSIENRDGMKVIITEKVMPFIDEVTWEMRVTQRYQSGPDMLLFEIYRTVSEETGEVVRRYISVLKCSNFEPIELIKFANACHELIVKHNASRKKW